MKDNSELEKDFKMARYIYLSFYFGLIIILLVVFFLFLNKWCRHQELNSGPDDYKSNGLSLNPTNTTNNEDYYWTTGNFLIDFVLQQDY